MITLRKSEERGHVNHGWLDSHFTFSFADYYDPAHMGFRSLRVINDDIVAPAQGFGAHPHRDMEIITYILSGALEHKDSMGNGRIIRPGEVQYMAAGTGVTHSEFNPSKNEPVHLLQIWIVPDKKNTKPNYAEKSFAKVENGKLHLAVSKNGRDGSIAINQDADLWVGKLKRGDKINHSFKPNRHGWLHVAEGEIDFGSFSLKAGDAAALSDEKEISLTAKSSAQVLFFDLN
ncbi:MAG TPA: pirin family protein [Verrucomicrobiae bacterium]